MSTRIAFALAVLVAACGVAVTRPPPPPPPPSGPPIPPAIIPSAPTPPPPPPLDQLLDQLEQVQAQKAELAKREESLKQIIRKKLDEQDQRLKKLGLAPPKEKEPDRVGRIIIEGNEKTDEEKILKLLWPLTPGAILHYCRLEEAQDNLDKAGFREATVEVVANEFDSAFKDIRVRVKESKR